MADFISATPCIVSKTDYPLLPKPERRILEMLPAVEAVEMTEGSAPNSALASSRAPEVEPILNGVGHHPSSRTLTALSHQST